MKVDTMRKIDRWAGVPLTFIYSIPLFLKDLINQVKKKKPDVSRTLFIELSEMGSAILVDPAMRKLRAAAHSELFFAIFDENSRSLEVLKTIREDHIFRMKSESFTGLVMDCFRFFFWCRKRKITCVLDLELFSRFTALLTGLSGSRYRVGFVTYHDEGMYRGNIINVPVRYNPHVHISINFINLVNSALGMHDTPYTTTPVEKEEIKLFKAPVESDRVITVNQKIKDLYGQYESERIILFNVNASDLLPQRKWLPEYFIQVGIHLLNKYEDILILATGSAGEKNYVQNIVDTIGNSRCLNAAGFFEFLELIPLYTISTLLLTNDSGPAHFASVTDLKIFAIFGPETPALYGPLGNAEVFYRGLPCSPCVSAANHRKTTCLTRPCVAGLLPHVVIPKLDEYLTA